MAKTAKTKEADSKKGPAPQQDERASKASAGVPRLLKLYRDEIHAALKKQFQFANDLAVPRVEKVVLNMGVGKAVENKNRIEHALRDLAAISGQKAVVTKARKSIAGFKLRENMPIGVMVTLRRERMFEFLDRLISIVMPRIRDFRGLPKKLDGRGNYSMGIAEQAIFSEINLDKLEFVQGIQITVVTSAKNDEHGFALLEALGFPFRK